MTDPVTTKSWLDVIWPVIDKMGMVALILIQTVGLGVLAWRYKPVALKGLEIAQKEWREWIVSVNDLTKELEKWRCKTDGVGKGNP